jgi:hypothetical protein
MDPIEQLMAYGGIADKIGAVSETLDGLGTRLAVDDETVAGGAYAIAAALDRLADTIADAMKTPRLPKRF